MARIENHKYSIEEAFKECFYIVPDYQREYVWTDKEVRQLLDDINEQIDTRTTSEYFIGTVLVSPASRNGEFEVIDGQQRLTTLFLLLCVLRQRFAGQPHRQFIENLVAASYTDANGDIKTTLKLEPRYEHAGELVKVLASTDGGPDTVRAAVTAATIPSFGSLENLLSAYTTISRYLDENYEQLTDLKKYWAYLAHNVIFIQISTDISSALKIFETINERGVGLNSMDLLKNLLFTRVKAEEFTQLKTDWKKITKPLEEADEKPLRFLRYFLMANYPITNKRNDAVLREDEIYDWLIDKDNAALCGYAASPFAFVRKIARGVELYLGFIDGKGNDGKPSDAMADLKRLTGAGFSLHHVMLLSAAGLPKALFEHFVRQLESFLFFYIFTKTSTKDLERNFSQWADEFRAIVAIKDQAQQQLALDAFVADRFAASMASKEKELADALKRYTLHTMQQYRTRYLLAKLTRHVEMGFKGLTTPPPLTDYTVLEIEHILPNNPEPSLRNAFDYENPAAVYDDYKNRLGNLTLLEKPHNIVASNDFYEKKKTLYRSCGNYLTKSLAGLTIVGNNSSVNRMNEKLRAYDTWSAASIDDRHDLLIALANDIWRTQPLVVSAST
jgi:uncharacterized protein DUF262/uncharacterized protein DUF1524